jgi:hypothetical protein
MIGFSRQIINNKEKCARERTLQHDEQVLTFYAVMLS